jgi:hypothetical protein
MKTKNDLRKAIRIMVGTFMVLLILSGITAFPLEWEIRLFDPYVPLLPGNLKEWYHKVSAGIRETNARYPFMAYGTDWLAFAHLVIAVIFIGVWKDPVRNIWILQFGMISCVMVFPLAFICGPVRGIPFFWQCIDCSFGIIGLIPLYICYRWTRQLEQLQRIS